MGKVKFLVPIVLGLFAAVFLLAHPLRPTGDARPDADFPQKAKTKPSAPIELDVRTAGRTDPGNPFGLIVKARSLVPADIELNVALPKDVTRVGGAGNWKGEMRKGETRELRLDLSVPSRERREILVTAVCVIDEKTRLAACRSLVLHEGPPAQEPMGELQKNDRGEDILDFRQK